MSGHHKWSTIRRKSQAGDLRDFTMHVGSMPTEGADGDALERLHDALDAMAEVIAPACGLDAEQGIIGATFSLEALTREDALQVGHGAFTRGLEQAGLSPSIGTWTLEAELDTGPDSADRDTDASPPG